MIVTDDKHLIDFDWFRFEFSASKTKACDRQAEFDCGDGMCIPNIKVCDQRVDCPAGQDEPLGKCGQDECKKNNGGCDHLCVDTPAGFYCDCHKGYVYVHNRNYDSDGHDGLSLSLPLSLWPSVDAINSVFFFLLSHIRSYELVNGTACVDIDECKVPGVCSQTCINELGSYKVRILGLVHLLLIKSGNRVAND